MKKYSKQEILEYFNIIGVDKEDLDLNLEKGLRVSNFDNLYKKTKASSELPKSALEVSRSYELILAIVNSELFYPSNTCNLQAKRAVLEELKEILSLQEYDFKNFDPDDEFEKTNRLIRTVLLGFACAENMPRFKIELDNVSPSYAYKAMSNHDRALEMRKLYGIAGLSKYRDFRITDNIYDKDNNVDLDNINWLLKGKISRGDPLKMTRYNLTNLDEQFERTSYKQLKKIKDYSK